jgi:hypothetical protein
MLELVISPALCCVFNFFLDFKKILGIKLFFSGSLIQLLILIFKSNSSFKLNNIKIDLK